MKQILLTDKIMKMAEEYSETLFKDKRSDFVQPILGLKNLQTDILEVNEELEDKLSYIAYIDKIIEEYDELKCLLPSKFEDKKEEYDGLLAPEKLSTVIQCRGLSLPEDEETRREKKPHKCKFYEEVVNRMRYEDARPVLAKYMMEKIGIQTCVYCNNAEATYADDKKEVYYHFDHWKPKDEYTFLSVCFFNLYPCCANCNGHKLDGTEGSFQLFAEDNDVADPFVFEIDRKEYVEKKPETLSVRFQERNVDDEAYCKEYNKVYRIEKFYNAPMVLRQVEKLLYDINSHRGSYTDATESSFPGIVDKEKLFHFVLGIDGDEKNIFTDAKKKLKIDTAKDAKLI